MGDFFFPPHLSVVVFWVFLNFILLLMTRILKNEIRESELGLFVVSESVSLSWSQIVVDSAGKH